MRPRVPADIIKAAPMVRDGYLYALPLIAAAVLIGYLTHPAWAIIPFLLAGFFLWFFRDPERAIPADPGALVSPADGKVTDVSSVDTGSDKIWRISIFLSVFDVHVNRTPIAGVVRDIHYQRGKFLDARSKECADLNEQNVVTVEGEGQTVIFKQIAGLLARRIVFKPKVGDRLERGQRVGLIKFGSRTDVLFDGSARIAVKTGDRVKGGASVLAYLQPDAALASTGASATERSRG
jgi:phosphatidylserine decarboxylase